jgi:hypothetical protein
MVSFDLIGISLPEVGDSLGETFALAEIGSNLHAVTGAGVLASAQPQILA